VKLSRMDCGMRWLHTLMQVRTPRDAAYLCFLGLAAVVAIILSLYAIGPLLPQSLGAAILVFVLLPVSGAGLLAASAGLVLSVLVRSDPRLYALGIAALALLVFWVRRDALEMAPAFAALYIPGALLFSLRWLAEHSRKEVPEHPAADGSAPDSTPGAPPSSASGSPFPKLGPFE